MDVLLSVKPKFADRIVTGDKKFEFRRAVFKSYVPKLVIVYVSSPMRRIIGSFTVGGVHAGKPSVLWKRFQSDAGMGRREFFEYFAGVDHGYAIRIERFVLFETPIDPFKKYRDFVAPQSFCYFHRKLPKSIK